MIRVFLEALRKEGRLEVIGTGREAMWQKRDNNKGVNEIVALPQNIS
jgi:hypothetical protein